MTVTTNEAARMVGVTPATIRSWVLRQKLAPVKRGVKPLRFHETDVTQLARQQSDPVQHARAVAKWEES